VIWIAGLVAGYVFFFMMTLGLGVTAKRADHIQRAAFERWAAGQAAPEAERSQRRAA
jgi:hypothetical protein